MYNKIHSDYIKTPLLDTLNDGILSCSVLDKNDINTYPLRDYFMQSLFLKMTGSQEQKLKCICWELATNDFEYRREYLNNKNYGEYSDYKAKNGIFKDLIKCIKKYEENFSIDELWNKPKQEVFSKWLNEIINQLDNSIIVSWYQKEFIDYKKSYKTNFEYTQFCTNNNLLGNSDFYTNVVYNHRNRCAHNTLSYQVNLPSLNKLKKEDYEKYNYFNRFTLLILIDEIFMDLYNYYLNVISLS